MSCVTTQPGMLAVTARNSHGVGSAMSADNTAVAVATIGVFPPAANEIGSDVGAIRRTRRDVSGVQDADCGDPRDIHERTGYERRIVCDQRDWQGGRTWVRMWR